MMTNSTISMADARAAAGYRQADLANALGISQACVSQYEHGHQTPSTKLKTRIAELLAVNPADLAFGEAGTPTVYWADARAHGGKRRRFRTQREAERYQEKFENAARGAAPEAQRTLLWDEAFELYSREQDARFKAGAIGLSQLKYKLRIITKFGDYLVDEVPVKSLRVGNINWNRCLQIKKQLDRAKLHTTTRRRKWGELKYFFDFLQYEEHIQKNPIVSRRADPSGSTQVADRISREAIASILRHSVDEYRLPILFAAYTGLRAGEQRALSWDHVDFGAKTIHVVRSIKHGEEKFGTPKSGFGIRQVPLVATLASELRKWKLEQPLEQRKHGLVFPDKNGEVMNKYDWLKLGLRPACQNAGVEPIRWHDLRHYFASVLLFETPDVQAAAVAKMLGHHDPKFTYQQYAHWMQDSERDNRLAASVEAALVGK